MRIIVIADTHMPRMAKSIPMRLKKELAFVDLIIHAGDWQKIQVYNELTKYAPIKGVYGNADDIEIINRFSSKLILNIKGYKIGITHGDGPGKTTEKRVVDMFKNDKLDLIIFGHSHIPINKELNGTILFNPGSPTDKRRQLKYSFGLITINDKMDVKHIYYNDKK